MPSSLRLLPPLLVGLLACLLLLPAGVSAAATRSGAVAVADRAWPGHPDRRLVPYRVHRGDTAASIAVHFHAWTAELRRINHKALRSTWYAGERVTVPVVVSAAAKAHAGHPAPAGHRATRTQVRAELVRTADRYRVPRRLVLAVAWHESGWQQQVRSSVGAVGSMQVMPSNRRYLSLLAGRPLRLRDLHDNVTAGVLLLDQLRATGHSTRWVLAAYYQGAGTLQDHGLYKSSEHYIANVLALVHRFRAGWRPDR